MISWYTVALALFMIILAGVLGMYIKKMRNSIKKNKEKRLHRLETTKSTYFLDEGNCDNMCEICFGEFEEYALRECKCGRIFHIECAEMTKECPYCKAKFEEMKSRPVRKPICPGCGKTIRGNICPCGIVVPNKDRTFKCVCGATVLIEDGVCEKCGSRFEPFYKT